MNRVKILFSGLIFITLISCNSIKTLLFNTEEEKEASALTILGNPPGTYSVSNNDIPKLLEFTKDGNPIVRDMALFQLQQLDTSSFLDKILPLTLDSDVSVSKKAEELIFLNKRSAVKVLQASLLDENKDLCLKSLDLLVSLDSRDSLSLIIELFNDKDDRVVEKAISSAAKLGSVNDKIFFDTLLKEDPLLRIGIVKTFTKIGDPAILGSLLPYFYDPDIKVQNAVKFAFVDFGEDSVPYLLNVLNNPVPKIQLSVLGLLEALQVNSSLPNVISLFNNENDKVQTGAIRTVSSFNANAVDALGEALNNNDDLIVLNSIKLLGEINTKESLNYLIPLLDIKNEDLFEAVFESILLFEEMSGNKFLEIIDNREQNLYSIAIKGLLLLNDRRLIVDDSISLKNRNMRGRILLLNSSLDSLTRYLDNIDISGLMVRDFILLKKINLASFNLIGSERQIRESESNYTTYYISRNEFIKKSEEALKLSFSFMHDYMSSRKPEDLETAKKQKEDSIRYDTIAQEFDLKLKNYVGSLEEQQLITMLEKSVDDILENYESVSINRKKLADEILSAYGLTYIGIISGDMDF